MPMESFFGTGEVSGCPIGIPVIENLPLGFSGLRLLGRGRGGDRLGTMRVPIASGGTGNHAGNQ